MENIIKVATTSTEAKELINNYVAPTPVEVQIAQEARKAQRVKKERKMNKAKFADRKAKMIEIFKANNGKRKPTLYAFVEEFGLKEGAAGAQFYNIKKLLAK